MRRANALLILSLYAISIFGYGSLEFAHFLAHSFKNPFHHHAVHKHSHHHHGIQDHGVSKLFKAANAEAQQAVKVVKALYFFSYQEISTMLIVKPFRCLKHGFFSPSFQLLEKNFPPPTPPPDLTC